MSHQEALLRVENISKQFTERRFLFRKRIVQAIDEVSFTLNAGETLALVGEAGAGKSTLARILAGVVPPSQGQIYVQGELIEDTNYQRRCQQIRMIFQDPNSSLNPRLRLGRILEAPLILNTELSPEERSQKVQDTLRMVGLLPEHALFYPQMISAGQKQRVALARALILNPSIIVADDTFSMLDLSVRSQIINLLLKLQEELGIAYVVVANDLGLVRHISDKVMVMHQGMVVESGPTEQVFNAPVHDVTKRLIQSYGHEYRR